MVILTDDDFADLPLTSSRAIEVLEFVPAEQVDPILYAKAYYLEPEGTATKPYVLLRDALLESDRVAIVKVALRQREQLATLRVRDDVLVLNTMLWPDEVRAAEFSFLDENITVRSQELAMASSLIDSMAGDFDPDQYTDEYRAALQEVIDAKVEGREVVAPPEEEAAPSGAIDLMAALRASVERARQARGETPARGKAAEEEREPVEPTPLRAARSARAATAATKATPAKKTAAKKAEPAKKTAEPAARKSTSTTKKTAAKKAEPAKKTAARRSA
jgi:DNA end-binding protein Ku